jgi:hypothetical protein
MSHRPRSPRRPRGAISRGPFRTIVAGLVAAAAALVTLLDARAVRAELWVSTMGDLLHTARRIEIVEVDQVISGGWQVHVVDAPRGRAAGTRDRVLWPGTTPTAAPGERLLVVCDSECPRAVGREVAGAFVLTAYQPMDGAWLTPPVVDRAAIPALARGASAPPLCLRSNVRFVDAPGAVVAIDASVDARTGAGSARPRAGGAALGATLQGADHNRGNPDEGIRLRIQNGNGARPGSTVIVLSVGGLTRRGTCLEAESVPESPISRTPAEFGAVWSGRSGVALLGSGPATITATAPIPRGTYPVRLESDDGGTLRLVGLPGVLPEPASYSYEPTAFRIGFPMRGRGPNAEVYVLVPRSHPWNRGSEGLELAAALRSGPAQFTISTYASGATRAYPPIGSMTIRRAP